MAKSVWQNYITDSAGDIIPLATVTVLIESSGALAPIYSDAAGSAKSNPFTADAAGLAQFYADGDLYKITATDGVYTAEFRNEPIGEAKGRDVGTDSGNLITVDDADARYSTLKKENTAAVDPVVTNDDSEGYALGSMWYNTATAEAFRCMDPATGAADWAKTTLTLDELGSMATKNAGSAGTEFEDNDAQDAKFLAKNLFLVEIAGTSYTLTASDNGKMLKTTNASAITITVPEDATEALNAGFQCIVQRGGDGLVTIAKEGTDTLDSADDLYTIDTKNAAASIVKQASGAWWMTGGLEALVSAGTAVGQLLKWSGTAWNPSDYAEIVIDQSSILVQNPAGTDTPLQVEFGAASGSGSDPAQISAAGLVTINEAAQYRIAVILQLERTGGTGTSIIHIRMLKNGSQTGETMTVELDNSSADLPITSIACSHDFSATDTVSYEIMRDSTGNDSGGLASKTVTAGWTTSPSARITVTKML